MQIPLARENSIIPVSTNGNRPRWTQRDPLVLHLVRIASGSEIRTSVYCTESRDRTDFICRRRGDVLTVHAEGAIAADVQLLLRSHREPAEIANGAFLGRTIQGIAIRWCDTREPISLRFVTEARVDVHVPPTHRKRNRRAAAK